MSLLRAARVVVDDPDEFICVAAETTAVLARMPSLQPAANLRRIDQIFWGGGCLITGEIARNRLAFIEMLQNAIDKDRVEAAVADHPVPSTPDPAPASSASD